MASSSSQRSHSHSHHHHHCPHCPLHRHCRHCPLRFQPSLPSLLPQNPHLFAPQAHPNYQHPVTSDAQISQELEHIDLDGVEEDDEPIFVLTDEWREFFAKSEARRKQEKKQAKKGKK